MIDDTQGPWFDPTGSTPDALPYRPLPEHVMGQGPTLGPERTTHDPVPPQRPSVGRIVHYQSYGTPGGEYLPEPRAAVITAVNPDGTVGLCVLNPTGMFFNTSVLHSASDEPRPGHWNWPPRV